MGKQSISLTLSHYCGSVSSPANWSHHFLEKIENSATEREMCVCVCSRRRMPFAKRERRRTQEKKIKVTTKNHLKHPIHNFNANKTRERYKFVITKIYFRIWYMRQWRLMGMEERGWESDEGWELRMGGCLFSFLLLLSSFVRYSHVKETIHHIFTGWICWARAHT